MNNLNPATTSTDLLKTLMQIGYLAANSQHYTEVALKIFNNLTELYPQSEYPYLGIAYVQLFKGNFDDCINTLNQKALKLNPTNAGAKAYLAMAYRCKGQFEESDKLIHEVEASGQEAFVNFAKILPQCIVSAKQ